MKKPFILLLLPLCLLIGCTSTTPTMENDSNEALSLDMTGTNIESGSVSDLSESLGSGGEVSGAEEIDTGNNSIKIYPKSSKTMIDYFLDDSSLAYTLGCDPFPETDPLKRKALISVYDEKNGYMQLKKLGESNPLYDTYNDISLLHQVVRYHTKNGETIIVINKSDNFNWEEDYRMCPDQSIDFYREDPLSHEIIKIRRNTSMDFPGIRKPKSNKWPDIWPNAGWTGGTDEYGEDTNGAYFTSCDGAPTPPSYPSKITSIVKNLSQKIVKPFWYFPQEGTTAFLIARGGEQAGYAKRDGTHFTGCVDMQIRNKTMERIEKEQNRLREQRQEG